MLEHIFPLFEQAIYLLRPFREECLQVCVNIPPVLRAAILNALKWNLELDEFQRIAHLFAFQF